MAFVGLAANEADFPVAATLVTTTFAAVKAPNHNVHDLMRLQAFVPPLNESVVGALASCGIKTDADLLFTDSVAIFRKLPPGIVSLREFCTLVKQVEEQAAAPAFRGDQFLKLQTKTCEDNLCGEILCGVPQLDELLGGFNPPRVIEISGDKGSGKTVSIYTHHIPTLRSKPFSCPVSSFASDTTPPFDCP